MKLIKHEKTDGCTLEMEMLLENEQMRPAISQAYKQEAKRYNVPGFRKGHAPRNLIEKMYGDDVFLIPAVNELFPEAFEAALKEAGEEAVSQAEIEDLKMGEEGATLKFHVKIKPEVQVGNYVGLEATRRVETVSEDQVDRQIEQMRERQARFVTREGTAALGDIATIDYEGSVDGVPFEGGKDEGHELTIGSGQFIPGFEEQVVGHAAGEEFDVKVTFPEEYHSDELAGKDAVFHVKIHEIKYKELPELDDEFAKDVSDEIDTLEGLKQDLRDKTQKEMDEAISDEVDNKLIEQLADTLDGDVPEEMYNNQVDEMVRDFSLRLQQQGLDLNSFLHYTGQDIDAFLSGYRDQAERVVKNRLALETVARQENLSVSDEDVDAELEEVAKRYNMEVDKVRELIPDADVRKDLLLKKAMAFIRSKAVITDEKPEEKSEENEEKSDENAE